MIDNTNRGFFVPGCNDCENNTCPLNGKTVLVDEIFNPTDLPETGEDGRYTCNTTYDPDFEFNF